MRDNAWEKKEKVQARKNKKEQIKREKEGRKEDRGREGEYDFDESVRGLEWFS